MHETVRLDVAGVISDAESMSVEQYQTGPKATEPEDSGETGEDWVRSIADPEDDPPVPAVESSWNRAVPVPPVPPTPARVVLRPHGRLGRDSTWTRAAYADASEGMRTPIPVPVDDPPRDTHHSATIELDVGDL